VTVSIAVSDNDDVDGSRTVNRLLMKVGRHQGVSWLPVPVAA
jgi:hypothetical protein